MPLCILWRDYRCAQGCWDAIRASHFIPGSAKFGIGLGTVARSLGLSFDVVLRDIFLPLTSGATLRTVVKMRWFRDMF
jgi:hypothetical protein